MGDTQVTAGLHGVNGSTRSNLRRGGVPLARRPGAVIGLAVVLKVTIQTSRRWAKFASTARFRAHAFRSVIGFPVSWPALRAFAARMQLTAGDQAIRDGTAAAMAMRIVLGTARMLGASDLVSIASAHIDGCLYHGDSGTHFAERLAEGGGGVSVPATLNVGALDLLHAGRVKLPSEQATMAMSQEQTCSALACYNGS